jgi:hypothetical protein
MIASYPETGCAGADVNTYFSSKTLTARNPSYGPPEEDPASDFWAMNDATADDAPDNVLDLSLNLKGCITDHKPAYFAKGGDPSQAGKTVGQLLGFTWDEFISSGNNYLDMTLTGTGSPSTNGYNRSVLQFRIYSSKWSGTSNSSNSGNNTSGNNTSGNNTSGNNTTGGGSSSGGTALTETEITMEVMSGAPTRSIQFVGISGNCASGTLNSPGSCTGKQSAETIVVIPQGTGTQMVLSGSSDGVTSATSGNANNSCVGPSGSDGRFFCYIAKGQSLKKIVWTFPSS